MTSILTTRRAVSMRYRLPMLVMPLLLARRPMALGQGVTKPSAATPEAPVWGAAELEAAGLTGPASYQSPLYGYTVEWSDAWKLDPVMSKPVDSWPEFGEGGRDNLYLAHAATPARFAFVSMPNDGRTIQQRFVEATEDLGPGREVVTSLVFPDAVMWVERIEPDDPDLGDGVIVNELVALDDGAALVIWLTSAAEALDPVFEDARGVFLDGEPMFEGLTVQGRR